MQGGGGGGAEGEAQREAVPEAKREEQRLFGVAGGGRLGSRRRRHGCDVIAVREPGSAGLLRGAGRQGGGGECGRQGFPLQLGLEQLRRRRRRRGWNEEDGGVHAGGGGGGGGLSPPGSALETRPQSSSWPCSAFVIYGPRGPEPRG